MQLGSVLCAAFLSVNSFPLLGLPPPLTAPHYPFPPTLPSALLYLFMDCSLPSLLSIICHHLPLTSHTLAGRGLPGGNLHPASFTQDPDLYIQLQGDAPSGESQATQTQCASNHLSSPGQPAPPRRFLTLKMAPLSTMILRPRTPYSSLSLLSPQLHVYSLQVLLSMLPPRHLSSFLSTSATTLQVLTKSPLGHLNFLPPTLPYFTWSSQSLLMTPTDHGTCLLPHYP